MQKIVDFFAPNSFLGAVKSFLILQSLIAPLNIVVYHSVLGGSWSTVTRTLGAGFLVSSPFVILALAMLAHLQKLKKQLAELAGTDTLTGLSNRRAFYELITCGPDSRLVTTGTMLMIGIDHFKRINDSFGHDAGDVCLKAVAAFLRALVQETDYVSRLGGEEFGYFTTRDTHYTNSIAEQLTAGLEVDIGHNRMLHLTVSVGLTDAAAGMCVKRVLSQADEALYTAKATGRARSITWSETKERLPEIASTAA